MILRGRISISPMTSRKSRPARASTLTFAGTSKPMRAFMNIPPRKGLNYQNPKADELPEDVALALAIIDGGAADFRRYIAEQRKKNCVSLDSSDAVAASMRALLRCLRDDNKRRQLVHILSNARFYVAPSS